MRPLLRMPPFRSDQPVLAVPTEEDGAESERRCAKPSETLPSELHQSDEKTAAEADLLKEMWRLRVGGAFWAPAAVWRARGRRLANAPSVVVSLPTDLAQAQRLWGLVAARAVETGLQGKQIGVVFPERAAFEQKQAETKQPDSKKAESTARGWQALRRQIKRADAGIAAQNGNPHSVLESAASLFAAELDDLAILGKGAGKTVWLLKEDGFEELSSEDALERITRAYRYRDPFSGAFFEPREAVKLLARWRETMLANRKIAACTGMAWWKRRRMQEFLAHAPGSGPAFFWSGRAALFTARRRKGALAVWAARLSPGLERAAKRAGVPLVRVEDGFVRSFGLGSGFLPPASIICDRQGNYFDPSGPSDLETLLATAVFTPELRARAQRLVDRLVREKISKYGAGPTPTPSVGSSGQRPDGCLPCSKPLTFPKDKDVILVPGQVADDMSVRLGGGEVRGNLELLERVRAARPNAWIVYRPHPDVEAGHRQGALRDEETRRYADEIVRGGAMAELLEQVDEVHTLTSLAGFEALLRGRRVTTWGQPFYAGWGLTEDRAPALPRRGRKLDVTELAAGTLILYPRYLDPGTGLPCGPETLLDRLGDASLWRPGLAMRLRKLQGQLRAWRRS